jgi:hypothetical protein
MKVFELIVDLGTMFLATIRDVAPIILLIAFYQIIVIKKNIPDLPRVFMGFVFVIIGLALFLLGLEKALFPIGDIMARQLSDPEFVRGAGGGEITWTSYYWIYLFAALIGFSTTIAEPSLIAVALKAEMVSGGAINRKSLRLSVALGVAFALAVGAFRIVTGHPLYLYILGGYVIVIIQTVFAPKDLVALAYDSGGVTTSTVTVPIVAALGLGLSASVEGRNPALDGFGLIAFASVFPIISVLAYAQFQQIVRILTKKKAI